MSFFAELKRRNVVRVAIAYALVALGGAAGGRFCHSELIGRPNWVLQLSFLFAVIGLAWRA